MAQTVKNLPANAGDVCLIPELGICAGGGNGNSSILAWTDNPMDRRAWGVSALGRKESEHPHTHGVGAGELCPWRFGCGIEEPALRSSGHEHWALFPYHHSPATYPQQVTSAIVTASLSAGSSQGCPETVCRLTAVSTGTEVRKSWGGPLSAASGLSWEPLECLARGPEPQLEEQNYGSGRAHVSSSSWQPQEWALGCAVRRGAAGPGRSWEPDPRLRALANHLALFRSAPPALELRVLVSGSPGL